MILCNNQDHNIIVDENRITLNLPAVFKIPPPPLVYFDPPFIILSWNFRPPRLFRPPSPVYLAPESTVSMFKDATMIDYVNIETVT